MGLHGDFQSLRKGHWCSGPCVVGPGPDVSGPTIAAFAFGERFAPRLRQTDHNMTVHVVLDESLQKGPVDLGV